MNMAYLTCGSSLGGLETTRVWHGRSTECQMWGRRIKHASIGFGVMMIWEIIGPSVENGVVFSIFNQRGRILFQLIKETYVGVGEKHFPKKNHLKKDKIKKEWGRQVELGKSQFIKKKKKKSWGKANLVCHHNSLKAFCFFLFFQTYIHACTAWESILLPDYAETETASLLKMCQEEHRVCIVW